MFVILDTYLYTQFLREIPCSWSPAWWLEKKTKKWISSHQRALNEDKKWRRQHSDFRNWKIHDLYNKIKIFTRITNYVTKKNFSNFIFSCFENNIIGKGFLLFVLHIENKTASDNSDTSVAPPNCNLRKFKVD